MYLVGCGLAQIPDNIHRYETRQAARYPWTVEAIDEEHKAKLCQALQLQVEDPFCQAGERVTTTELMEAVAQRFPVNQTPYPEVATALQDFLRFADPRWDSLRYGTNLARQVLGLDGALGGGSSRPSDNARM